VHNGRGKLLLGNCNHNCATSKKSQFQFDKGSSSERIMVYSVLMSTLVRIEN
jgi:hypothetical protein